MQDVADMIVIATPIRDTTALHSLASRERSSILMASAGSQLKLCYWSGQASKSPLTPGK
jgi:hypothetical protein